MGKANPMSFMYEPPPSFAKGKTYVYSTYMYVYIKHVHVIYRHTCMCVMCKCTNCYSLIITFDLF